MTKISDNLVGALPMLEKAKHTPGPWHYTPAKTITDHSRGISMHLGAEVCDSGNDGHIAKCPNGKHAANWEANARLIASAPELLEALEQCLEVLQREFKDNHVNQRARQAIAKAKIN